MLRESISIKRYNNIFRMSAHWPHPHRYYPRFFPPWEQASSTSKTFSETEWKAWAHNQINWKFFLLASGSSFSAETRSFRLECFRSSATLGFDNGIIILERLETLLVANSEISIELFQCAEQWTSGGKGVSTRMQTGENILIKFTYMLLSDYKL